MVPDSERAACEQYGDAVDDGKSARTAGAADVLRIERESAMADGADEPAEAVLGEGLGGGLEGLARHGRLAAT
jgi:hypothetical protein